ncbi:MAG TPA: hypothetical protein VH268_07470 [Solirubrobacterales bacterium]|jgi:hypothetical protein|nr:hypothetical protein [Solirubrobacterales bacterium]
MSDERNRDLTSVRDQRNVESVVLARSIERHPNGLTEVQAIEDMTTIVNTPERIAAVHKAIEGLIEVNLLIRVRDALHPTPAALRAGELELGI